MKPPDNTSLRFCLLTVLAVSLFGCGSRLLVQRASPRPNVAVSADRAPTRVSFGPDVMNDYIIPETGTVRTVHVTDWHATLENGFRAAFFEASASNVTLAIEYTELSFAPRTMDSRGTTRAVSAQLRFRATLIDSAGASILRIADTVESREAITSPSPSEMTRSASQAVEAMYERIAAAINQQSAPAPTVQPTMGAANPSS